jgi:hypothetical protein
LARVKLVTIDAGYGNGSPIDANNIIGLQQPHVAKSHTSALNVKGLKVGVGVFLGCVQGDDECVEIGILCAPQKGVGKGGSEQG